MELLIPNHIAIIMDGNGRWANSKGMPRTYGHKAGADTLRKVVSECAELGVGYLTVFAFSTENWKRVKEEVDMLMFLFKTYLKKEKKILMKNNIRFIVSGKEEGVESSLLKEIRDLEEVTKDNTGLTLNIAFNYGGRAEIIDAVNNLIKDRVETVTEEIFEKYLYNSLPDPDLLIRTSGEMRISNFLLWQIAYSEIYVTEINWPDFGKEELMKALESYSKRNRRFGG